MRKKPATKARVPSFSLNPGAIGTGNTTGSLTDRRFAFSLFAVDDRPGFGSEGFETGEVNAIEVSIGCWSRDLREGKRRAISLRTVDNSSKHFQNDTRGHIIRTVDS